MSANVTLPGAGAVVETIDTSTSGVTNATTAAGNAVLHFAATPIVSAGMVIANSTTPSSITAGSKVLSFTSTTVTMDQNAIGAGVGNGDTITFAGGQRQRVSAGPSTDEIGRTNIKHVNVVGSTLTRPGNVTPYSTLDSVSDNATAASVTANTVTISDTNDDPVDITEINLDSTDTGFGGVPVRLHIFTSDPTASSGVVGGDNVAWSNKRAGWAGSFTGTMVGFSDGSKGTLIPDGPAVRVAHVETGGKRLWWQLQVLAAATPSANSTTFIPRFKGYQGRA